MRILCISDVVDKYLYNSENSVEIKPDLIVSCGDLPKDYLEFLMSKFNVPLFFVQGNHDNYYSVEHSYDYQLAITPKSKFNFHSSYDYTNHFGGINLDRKIVDFNGITLLGFEGCHKYNDGIHQYDQNEMVKRVRSVYWKIFFRKLLRKPLDIVVAHAPPYKIHDKDDIVHTGFKVFLELIEKFKPKYFLHGHTHIYDIREDRVFDYKGTKVINCYGYYVLDV